MLKLVYNNITLSNNFVKKECLYFYYKHSLKTEPVTGTPYGFDMFDI